MNLALPVISRIRRQEARAVENLIQRHAHSGRTALEVGPGTGFYTLMLARAFREVVAVEDSPRMAEILRRKLTAADVRNVTVVNHDFLALPLDDRFDVVIAIGVLDYIAEPAQFVAKMCGAARRAVIVTAPQRGMWGTCFRAGGRLRKTAVYCHDRGAPNAWAPGWRCSVTEVGLNSRVTRGLTLVVTLEPAQVGVSVRTP